MEKGKKNAINFRQINTANSLGYEELKLAKREQMIVSTLAKRGPVKEYELTKRVNDEIDQEFTEIDQLFSKNIDDFANKYTVEQKENPYYPRNLSDDVRAATMKKLKEEKTKNFKKKPKAKAIAQSVVRYRLLGSLIQAHIIQVVGKLTRANYGKKKTYAIATKGLILAVLYETEPTLNRDYLGEEFDRTSQSFVVGKIINPHKATFRVPLEGNNSQYLEYYLGGLDSILRNNKDYFGIDLVAANDEIFNIARMSMVVTSLELAKFFSPVSYCLWETDEEFEGFVKCKNVKLTSKMLKKLNEWENIRKQEFLSMFFSEPLLKKWQGWDNWLDMIREDPIKSNLVAEYLVKKESDYESNKAAIEQNLERVKEIEAHFRKSLIVKD
jgi:hypothetical protein